MPLRSCTLGRLQPSQNGTWPPAQSQDPARSRQLSVRFRLWPRLRKRRPRLRHKRRRQPSTFRASVRPSAKVGTPAGTADRAASVDLADMFGEIRHELEEEVSSAEEDPETHYNLGVAFREMGLLDEAIGELQKVCQAIDHGHPFPQVMQTYTWLAQCFLDKGVPQAAIRWYQEALKLPTLDQETRTALHYELASSYEAAQDNNAALRHFMEVYGSNIDYRDVSERIQALKS